MASCSKPSPSLGILTSPHAANSQVEMWHHRARVKTIEEARSLRQGKGMRMHTAMGHWQEERTKLCGKHTVHGNFGNKLCLFPVLILSVDLVGYVAWLPMTGLGP